MNFLKVILLSSVVMLSGCTNLERLAYMYVGSSPDPIQYEFNDGGSSLYYSFILGDEPNPETLIFFYGGSGCNSWKAVMPGYLDGFTGSARVFTLNKRFVADKAMGFFGCSDEFLMTDNPSQWAADYLEFLTDIVQSSAPKAKNIVLVGVSEGAMPAVKVASKSSLVTHLAIIGNGAWSMRKSLEKTYEKEGFSITVEMEWAETQEDPRSITEFKYGHPYRWWSDVMDISPLEDYLKLDIPILLGIGEQDRSVPVESARALQESFEKAGKSNLTLKVYPGANHHLKARDGMYVSDFFGRLSDFIK